MPSFPDFSPVAEYKVAGMGTAGLGVVCMVTLMARAQPGEQHSGLTDITRPSQTLPTITGPSLRHRDGR